MKGGESLTFLDAGDTRLLGVRGDGSIVGWGVLRGPVHFFTASVFLLDKRSGKGKNPYGATGKSAFLFLMGSDMMRRGRGREGLKRGVGDELKIRKGGKKIDMGRGVLGEE